MNYYDKMYIAEAVNYFFPSVKIRLDQVNTRIVRVLYEAIIESQKCTASIDLVPRPSSGVAGIAYMVTQMAIIGKNISSGDTRTYMSCKNAIGASLLKTNMTMALRGA